jgi:hypothetical protein
MNYFSDNELACRHCGEIKLAEGFLDKLNALRLSVAHPMTVNSCCRCKYHNTNIGGKADSFHLTSHAWGCCAIDISMVNWTSQKRWTFIRTAMAQGWSIGVNFQKNFIHLDRRTDYDTGWAEPIFFPY